MKTTLILAALLFILISTKSMAQVSLKTEYFGTSDYKDNNGNKLGNSKGSAVVYSGIANIPLAVKMSKDSLVSAWSLNLSGAYASLENKNFTQDLVLSDITNLQFSVVNMRQLNQKWSLIAFAGAGIYTNETQISKVNANSILGNGGAIFVKKINPKLDLGAGLALTNAIGYPMLFPAIYVNYNSEGKYTFRFSMLNGIQASAGYNINKTFGLGLIAEANGQMALLKKEGENVIFTHQYLVAGLRPEIKITKNLNLPITLGVNATRFAYFNDRNLKSIFNDKETSHFDFSPYVAAEINYKF
jgi:hypothetical protein